MSRFDLFFILVDDCNEVTDYAIARRIVDLHESKQQIMDRVYSMVSVLIGEGPHFKLILIILSQEEIQRYLLFARLFKPRICKESTEYMVDEYKKLRQRDSSGK